LSVSAAAIRAQAMAMLQDGRIAEARTLLQQARLANPTDPGIALALADALHAERRLPAAIAAYQAALRLDDTSAEGWYGAGCAQLAQKSFGDAAASLEHAARLAPRSGPAQYNLGKAVFELGKVDSAVGHFNAAARLDPALVSMAKRSIACIIPGSDAADHADIRRARRDWAQNQARATGPPIRQRRAARGGKLRIGYVSAFFGARNWMKPVFALINRHDRTAFDIHMFCDGGLPSAASGYADHDNDVVHDLTGVPNAQAAAIIANAGIDILVDLNGYSAPERLPMLMHRPAARIVGWFNMFATTGLTAVDWLVGDESVIRPEEEPLYTERIHRVPGTYLAFEILYPVPDVAPPPCCGNAAGLTFGCLGSQYKITDAVLAAWATILRAAPNSRLFIKNGTLEDNSTQRDLLARLHSLGVAAERMTLQGRSEHFCFLDAYRHVDIALDTFPYNGGTTTTEALWQGVPVLAFDGDRWASRTSASLLRAAGLAEWVMPDAASYVERAISLATDPATRECLAVMRATMRHRLSASAICDVQGLCCAMEGFYRSIARA